MVDALASGASVPRDVEVQVLSRVPMKNDCRRQSFFIGGILTVRYIIVMITADEYESRISHGCTERKQGKRRI
jgi:hypothetical protein